MFHRNEYGWVSLRNPSLHTCVLKINIYSDSLPSHDQAKSTGVLASVHYGSPSAIIKMTTGIENEAKKKKPIMFLVPLHIVYRTVQ